MSVVDPESDQSLLARVCAGDSHAFDAVHARFHARLFNFLARLSRSRDVGEDLLEETWLRFVQSAPRLRPDTTIGPWLFTVARNLYLSYCRSRSLETGLASDWTSLEAPVAPGPSPFDAAAATETEHRLERALASLPVAYREVLLLVGVEGLQPVEAAAICGVSPEALRQRLRRARVLLTRRMEEREDAAIARVREVLP
jgi:RNA polymerase sigma-70 factor, ECF subfamily